MTQPPDDEPATDQAAGKTNTPADFHPDEVLAVARASAGRRILGLTSLAVLGGMLIWIALVENPAFEWRLMLLVLGGGALWLVKAMRSATATNIELTPTALRDSDGTVIALIEDIEGMDRGFFAFKPSNGFLLRTRDKGANTWRPGMWWRLGRRIGVGGMTTAHQCKQVSEIIAIMMAQRDLARGDLARGEK